MNEGEPTVIELGSTIRFRFWPTEDSPRPRWSKGTFTGWNDDGSVAATGHYNGASRALSLDTYEIQVKTKQPKLRGKGLKTVWEPLERGAVR